MQSKSLSVFSFQHAFKLTLGVLVLMLGFSVHAQGVYKTKDKDGNVIFTDSAPSSDSQPLKTKPLNVVGSPPVSTYSRPIENAQAGKGGKATLSIVSPVADQTLRDIAGVLTISVQSNQPPRPDSSLIITLDGRNKKTKRGLSIEFDKVYRGEHRVSARLVNARGKTISKAKPVVFYVRQHSTLN